MDKSEIIIKEGTSLEERPACYEWSILEAFNSSQVKCTTANLYLDLVDRDNEKWVMEWKDRLKKIGKPFIYAKGILRRDTLEGKKSDVYKKVEERERLGRPIKKSAVYYIKKEVVYGLFSDCDV